VEPIIRYSTAFVRNAGTAKTVPKKQQVTEYGHAKVDEE